jgi:hypothetical protein
MKFLTRMLDRFEASVGRWLEKPDLEYEEYNRQEDRRYAEIEAQRKQAEENAVKAAFRVPDPALLIRPVHLTNLMPSLFGAGVRTVGIDSQGDIHVTYDGNRKVIYIATEVAHGT